MSLFLLTWTVLVGLRCFRQVFGVWKNIVEYSRSISLGQMLDNHWAIYLGVVHILRLHELSLTHPSVSKRTRLNPLLFGAVHWLRTHWGREGGPDPIRFSYLCDVKNAYGEGRIRSKNAYVINGRTLNACTLHPPLVNISIIVGEQCRLSHYSKYVSRGDKLVD